MLAPSNVAVAYGVSRIVQREELGRGSVGRRARSVCSLNVKNEWKALCICVCVCVSVSMCVCVCAWVSGMRAWVHRKNDIVWALSFAGIRKRRQEFRNIISKEFRNQCVFIN